MDENQQKEQFSNAYLSAVVAAAGYNKYRPEVDDDSIDLGIGTRGGSGTIRSPRVELQLKCSGRDLLSDDYVSFPLKLKNYDDLRHEDFMVPRILVVVLVPADVADWLAHTEESLVIRHCAYWMSIRGLPESDNSETVTVRIPRMQTLTVESLRDMMERIAIGGLP